MFFPDSDLDYVPIPDTGFRGQKGTGSRIRIRNTVFVRWCRYSKEVPVMGTGTYLMYMTMLCSFDFKFLDELAPSVLGGLRF